MKRILFIATIILCSLAASAQFTDTSDLNTYIRENIRDKRPEKVTAEQIQTGMLGISNTVTKYNALGMSLSNNSGAGIMHNNRMNSFGIDSLSVFQLGFPDQEGGSNGSFMMLPNMFNFNTNSGQSMMFGPVFNVSGIGSMNISNSGGGSMNFGNNGFTVSAPFVNLGDDDTQIVLHNSFSRLMFGDRLLELSQDGARLNGGSSYNIRPGAQIILDTLATSIGHKDISDTYVEDMRIGIDGKAIFNGKVQGVAATENDEFPTLGQLLDSLSKSIGTVGTYTKVTTDAQGRVTSGTTLSSGDIPSLSSIYIPITQKGAANGVAPVGSDGKIPSAFLPVAGSNYIGTWNANTNTPTLSDGIGSTGDYYITNVAGTQDLGSGSISFGVGDNVVYNGSSWQKVPTGNSVVSVNGKIGTVVIDKTDVGLSDVDNTSDLGKPISTATQTALNLKSNSSVTITAGTGLTGGGNLTTNRTISANFGTSAGTIAQGNDSRILNGQTAFGWGNHASAGYLTTTTGDARYPVLSGSYNNPSWLTGLAWSKITGEPTTLSGYGITDAMNRIPATGSWNGFLGANASFIASNSGSPNSNTWYGLNIPGDASNGAQIAIRDGAFFFRGFTAGSASAWTTFAPVGGSANYIQNLSTGLGQSASSRITGSYSIFRDGSDAANPFFVLNNAGNTRGAGIQLNGATNPGLAFWVHNGTAQVKRFELFSDGGFQFPNVLIGNSSGRINIPVGFDAKYGSSITGTGTGTASLSYLLFNDASGDLRGTVGKVNSTLNDFQITSPYSIALVPNGNVSTNPSFFLSNSALSLTTGQFALNNLTANNIFFGAFGTGLPTFTTRSAGSKVVLFPNLSPTAADFSLGVASGVLWSTVPQNTTSYSFDWYGGTTRIGRLNGVGQLEVAGVTATNYTSNSNLKLTAPAGNETDFYLGSTQKMTLSNDGLSIGLTPSPIRASPLQVAGNVWSEDAFLLGPSGSSVPDGEFGLAGDGDIFVRTMGTGDITFRTSANTVRAKVNGTTGNFEVPLTVKAGAVDVNGQAAISGSGVASFSSVTAPSVNATATLHVGAVYTKTRTMNGNGTIASDDYTINLASPTGTGGHYTVTLPNPASYEGRELEFWAGTGLGDWTTNYPITRIGAGPVSVIYGGEKIKVIDGEWRILYKSSY